MITKSLILALILCESGGNPTAQSPVGALGLTQMTDVAYREVQEQYGLREPINYFNPQENIKYGVLLFEHYLRRVGSLKYALIVYNGGYSALNRYKRSRTLPEETRLYFVKVLTLMRNLDPMFQRQLPEPRERTYIELAVDDVFYDLYGIGTEYK